MKEAAFPKAHRLRKRREFLRVQRHGTKIHTRHFLVLAAVQPTDRSGPSRLGVTVTRKVAGAVGRNAIKRRVREAFRRHRTRLPAGFDLVVIAKRSAVEATLEDADRMIRKVAAVLRAQAGALAAPEARQ